MLSDETRAALDGVLAESEVLGLRVDPQCRWCDVWVQVVALPATGPLDPDPRRIVRLSAPGEIEVMLRPETPDGDDGPVEPLADLAAVEDVFASLVWSGSMGSGGVLDDPAVDAGRSRAASLRLTFPEGSTAHTFTWFNECGRPGLEGPSSWVLEGVVRFADLEVLRADGTAVPLPEALADARRYWRALHAHDARVSVAAQGAAAATATMWRPHLRPATHA